MSRTKMRALALILLSYLPSGAFLCISVYALLLEYSMEYNHETSRLCRIGHDNASRTRMATLAFILYETFPLDCFRCNFVSAP